MCFHESTPQDICWGGAAGQLAKGVGTAQRRTAGRILHHGSIKLGPSPLEPEVATLADRAAEVSPVEAGRALRDGFAREFGVDLEPCEPDAELRAAAEAMADRYSAPEFLHRETRRRR
jgi:lipoate-protein ligase A